MDIQFIHHVGQSLLGFVSFAMPCIFKVVIGIPDINDNFVSTKDIKEAISGHHYADMKGELEKSSKLEDIKHEDFRKQQAYMQ